MQISNGDLKRELIMAQEALSKENIPLPGRVSFFLLLQRYKLDRGQSLHVDLSGLMQLEYKGDLEQYLDKLDSVLMNLANETRRRVIARDSRTSAAIVQGNGIRLYAV
jgi:cytoplasmic iron level regulating protein YaaA (DUF328/UPF0246 family)